MTQKPLKIFVAMPGGDLGLNASFRTSEGVKKGFLEPIRKGLEEALHRPVEMKIEKDEDRPGSFGQSMFKEAFEAEVYLADLTGANPNVYLELGVRWAARDNVTVLVIQDMKDYKPNIGQQKVIQYGGKTENLPEGIQRTVNAIVQGLRDKAHVDSLVRLSVPVVTCSQKEWEEMRQTIEQLRAERGEEYLDAAMRTNDLKQRIELLLKAIHVNPFLHAGHYELGRAYANSGDKPKAAESYREAIRLSDRTAKYHKDFGIFLSRWGEEPPDQAKIQQGIQALGNALEIDDADADTQAALGGAMRRLAMWQAPRHVDVDKLEEAQKCYDRAARLSNGNDPYPLLNSARIELLLAGLGDKNSRLVHLGTAQTAFTRVLPLCQYKVNQASEGSKPWWAMLDLHDCLLFSGRVDEAATLLAKAKSLIPETEFAGVREAFLSPYIDFLSLTVLDGAILDAAKVISQEWSSASATTVQK